MERLYLKRPYLKNIAVLVIWGLIAAAAFYFYRNLQFDIMALDDIGVWYKYNSTEGYTLFDAMGFGGVSLRFRPLFGAVSYLMMLGTGPDLSPFYYINMTFILVTAFMLCLFVYRATKRMTAAFMLSVLLVFSHCSWYAVSQMHGVMENMCMLFAMAMFLCLQSFWERPRFRMFVLAVVMYGAAGFSNERSFALIVPLLLALLLLPEFPVKEKLRMLPVAFIPVILEIISLKALSLDIAAVGGTGGAAVSFDAASMLKFFFLALGNVFVGPSGDPLYSGEDIWQHHPGQLVFGIISLICFLIIAVLWAVTLVRTDKASRRKAIYRVVVVFGGFVFLTGIACTTVTMDKRWLYAPYMLVLAMTGTMLGDILAFRTEGVFKKLFCEKRHVSFPLIVLAAFTVFSLGVNIKSYEYRHSCYFVAWQYDYENRYEDIFESYGDSMADRVTYVIAPPPGIGDASWTYSWRNMVHAYYLPGHPGYDYDTQFEALINTAEVYVGDKEPQPLLFLRYGGSYEEISYLFGAPWNYDINELFPEPVMVDGDFVGGEEGDGWYEDQGGSRWTAKDAYVAFEPPQGAETLSVLGFCPQGQSGSGIACTLTDEDTGVSEVVFEGAFAMGLYVIDIPLPEGSRFTLEISCDKALPQSGEDARELGLLVYDIGYKTDITAAVDEAKASAQQ